MLAILLVVIAVLVAAGIVAWWLAGHVQLGESTKARGESGITESQLTQVRQEKGRSMPGGRDRI